MLHFVISSTETSLFLPEAVRPVMVRSILFAAMMFGLIQQRRTREGKEGKAGQGGYKHKEEKERESMRDEVESRFCKKGYQSL
jgi:hypothetical protein